MDDTSEVNVKPDENARKDSIVEDKLTEGWLGTWEML